MEMKSGRFGDRYGSFVINLFEADNTCQRVSDALIGLSEAGAEDCQSHDMVALNPSVLALQGRFVGPISEDAEISLQPHCLNAVNHHVEHPPVQSRYLLCHSRVTISLRHTLP